jgi:hypothetical protein
LLETAALALISGTKIQLTEKKFEESSEWIVVLGAAGAVGSSAVKVHQLSLCHELTRLTLMNITAREALRLQSTGFLLSS